MAGLFFREYFCKKVLIFVIICCIIMVYRDYDTKLLTWRNQNEFD